ncbi:MAG: polysaccharide biosynthesis protein [Lachnospiraceae bacterium]|nr:polysaccharide biosynthesis protein [Lachnospiraceae bacterium]MDD7025499.1 polysaccharide biosynthesis protein [Lachnospiraceae bacterium]MDY5699777.1 polysaccharide biosynthesis protein [Lachnospiraceae bacterium]
MGQKSKKDGFILQAGILAAAGIVVRIIGILYRSPLVAIIGDEGNGYYNTAYVIYTIILLVSSYSIPSAVSKVIAAKLAKGEYQNAHKIFMGAFYYVIVVGGLASLACFFFAEKMVGESSAQVLRVFSPTIFLSGLLGVMRGYFQAHKSMIQTSFSQILEQILNALVSIGAAFGLMSLVRNKDATTQAIYGAMGSALGTGAGVLAALLFMVSVYGLNRGMFMRRRKRDRTGQTMTYRQVFGLIIGMVTPVLLSTCIYNMSSAMNLKIYCGIMENIKSYTEAQATTYYGLFSGKANQITNIPIALATAMSSAIIPSISASFEKKAKKECRKKISSAIKTTMLISIPAAVGLAVLARPVVYVLYPQAKTLELVAGLLRVLAVSVVFYGLSTLSNGVLQGTGYVNKPVIHAAVALVVQTAVLVLLLLFTGADLYALAAAAITYSFCMSLFNGISMRKKLRYRQEMRKTFLIPTLASLPMGMAAWLVYQGGSSLFVLSGLINRGEMNWLYNCICLAAAILIAAPIYFALVIKLGAVGKAELAAMPGGRRIAGIGEKLHLLK